MYSYIGNVGYDISVNNSIKYIDQISSSSIFTGNLYLKY